MWIMHSAKGTTWKKHKYIRIENGRYVYDTEKGNRSGTIRTGNKIIEGGKASKLSGRVAANMANKEDEAKYIKTFTPVRSDNSTVKKPSNLWGKSKGKVTKSKLKNVANSTVASLKKGDMKEAITSNRRLIDDILKSKGKMSLKKNKKVGKIK